MDLDDIQAQLDRLFAARGQRASREDVGRLRETLLTFKVGLGEMRDALATSERELPAARQELETYQRRGRLAADIGDAETVRIADEYTAKARERVDLLERKVLVQRDELAMAERDYAEARRRFDAASRGVPLGGESPPADAGAADPALGATLDQRARDAAVDAQLEQLKKKMGERK